MSEFVLNEGGRLALPEFATIELYALMKSCWRDAVEDRPGFVEVLESLKKATGLHVDQQKDPSIDSVLSDRVC